MPFAIALAWLLLVKYMNHICTTFLAVCFIKRGIQVGPQKEAVTSNMQDQKKYPFTFFSTCDQDILDRSSLWGCKLARHRSSTSL